MMERVAIILLVFVLLLSGGHHELMPPRQGAIRVHARALPLDQSKPDRHELGELHYLGGWALTSDHPDFGGISSLSVDDAGTIVALSDGAAVMTFPAGRAKVAGSYHMVPGFFQQPQVAGTRPNWDTESMARDPATGTIWVGYEGDGHICRYGAGFSRVEACALSAEAAQWPSKTSMESLVRLQDGRFLAIAEDSPGPQGRYHDVLLFAGDPVDPATPPPARLSYVAPTGYLPTDAVAIGNGKMLVMNRRLTLMDLFTGILTLVDIHDLRPGAVLRGREVARFAPPIQHDNLEALAMSREKGRPILWIASDDNHLFFQRSLLFKFAMPDRWFQRTDGVNR